MERENQSTGSDDRAREMQRMMRFHIDFAVETDERPLFADEIPEQRRLWEALLRNPAILRRVAVLVLVNEVKGRMDHLIEETLPSADYEDLIACVQEELPEEDRRYWDTVQRACIQSDELTFRLFPVFEAFRVSLRQVLLEDLATGDSFPMKCRHEPRSRRTVIPIREASGDRSRQP
jgi:hypothetical protein